MSGANDDKAAAGSGLLVMAAIGVAGYQELARAKDVQAKAGPPADVADHWQMSAKECQRLHEDIEVDPNVSDEPARRGDLDEGEQ